MKVGLADVHVRFIVIGLTYEFGGRSHLVQTFFVPLTISLALQKMIENKALWKCTAKLKAIILCA